MNASVILGIILGLVGTIVVLGIAGMVFFVYRIRQGNRNDKV